ncbi:MAG: phosphoenolpyruvate--protein phosphotransferase [Deltaproteobacteria bacterium]|nr:MAG: phosphoenolpyruvate--protein phosphotransferase [Deltaproteobacteria bacterium]
MADTGTGEKILTGISGSPGICIGKAYIVDREGVNVIEKYYIRKEKLQDEIRRFKAAVKTGKDELAAVIKSTPAELRLHVDILETHMALYKDKMLYGRTIETIEREMVNAEWALKKVVSEVKAMFQNISDPYIKGRATDIAHVSDRIMRNLIGAGEFDIAAIDKRVILVAHDLSPADTSKIKLERVKGFVTDLGGKTSHTGIIARTLGIPSVLGLDNATSQIKSDDLIIVDGRAGIVVVHPTDKTIALYEDRLQQYEEYKAVITRSSQLPAETADGVQLQVMGNIELPEEVVSVMDHGGDGVGLFRTEFLYLRRTSFPSQEELYEQYKEVVELMAPKPVVIRTLDINGDKALSYANNSDDEVNPALGLRAIRFCLRKPNVFKEQLKAILRAALHGNAKIMFPMISSVEEVVEAKRLLEISAEELDKEGIRFQKNIKTGIMIEVPSAVIMADVLAKEVDFFSIGTNDLVQYSLAIDRGNRKVAYLYNTLHPAVIRMVKHVVDVGKEQGVSVLMCGEMAGDPYNMPVLLGLGMNELSMVPQSIPGIKDIAKKLKTEDSKLFLLEVLKQPTTSDVLNLIQNTYGNLLPEKK